MTEHYTNNRPKDRFELTIDRELVAWVDYELAEDSIALNHTEVNPPFRGRGHAGDIVEFALIYSQIAKRRVVPNCAFVASFIERNAEYEDLVA
ncbi:MAG TPA: GNAT family N-acetyltransferase [Actinomycetota bacterium]|jgi:predicted GNAT family acetyltransferase|nr:GNAT family N-acetyltransferase [Actinomycetota bacterium]